MSSVTILHLSDIHFKKKEKEGFRYFHASVQKKMLKEIGAHVKKHGEPDFTVVTGDISFDGKEYEKAKEFFTELKKIMPKTVFLPVPGNHDVDRDEVDDFFSLYNIVEKKKVSQFLESEKSIKKYIIPKFAKFTQFANGINPDIYKSKDDYFWVKNFPDKNVSFLGLNSAWACEGDKDRFNITLGYPQVLAALEKSEGINNRILLMHHPVFNWFNDQDFSQCKKEIFKKCSLILHGHTHVDDAFLNRDPTTGCICIGASATYTRKENCYIGYHFLDVVFSDKGVKVKVWPYIFDERTGDIEPDTRRWGKAQEGKSYYDIFFGLDKAEIKESTGEVKLGPDEDFDHVFQDYKRYALREHRHLPMKGFETNIRAPIEIEQVYVTMRAHIQFCDFEYTIEGKRKVKERFEREQLSDLDIKGTFKALQKQKIKDIVILGDPGSGKTTLLKYILVMLIEGRGEEKLGLDSHLIPFFVPLRELKDPGREDFVDFVCRVCCVGNYSIKKEDFGNLLKYKGAIILLDGLDEVADEKTRIKTCQWIDDVRRKFIHTTFIVTSRFAGYLGESKLEGSVLELSIQDFNMDEVAAFLVRWFETVEVALHPGDDNEDHWRAKGREEALKLVKNIKDSEHIRKLAVNPLMLQIIALIRRDRGAELPERRVELYHECVNVLLEKWDIARGLGTILRARESREILQPLALWLHEEEGRRSAPLEEIKEQIREPLENLGKSGIDIEKLLLNIRDRSGIFLGYSESEYGFAHLGFQEYLAAEEIRSKDRLDLLIENYGNRWWREVTLLALALNSPSIISPFMERVVQTEAFKSDITLICDAVNDSIIKPYDAFIKVFHGEEISLEIRQNAVRVLVRMGGNKAVAALKDVIKHKNVALAGAAYQALESLNAAEGIAPPKKAAAPAIIKIEKDVSEMVLIPEGNFIYGSREDDKEARQNEKPQQTIYLPSYYMDKYPVTNRQYCLFLNERKPGKEELENWIDLSGSYEKERCRIAKKGMDFQVESGYDNYPVIYVSWFGAEAYGKWCGKRLPYEVEWEKAARGTDGRKYPWGNEFNKKKCNSYESRIRHTTPVIAYPKAQSSYGCYDMAGNVWEWCADWFEENNDKTGNRLKGPRTGSDRVLRGGSWNRGAHLCRASFRLASRPSFRWHNGGLRLARSL